MDMKIKKKYTQPYIAIYPIALQKIVALSFSTNLPTDTGEDLGGGEYDPDAEQDDSQWARLGTGSSIWDNAW